MASLTAAGAGAAVAVANGERVPEGTYRFAVELTMPDITRPDGTHYASACSAALVAPQWIVTAGHCLHDGAGNRVSGPVRYRVIATLGTADLDSGNGLEVDVVDARQAPSGADVALARLDHPVDDVPTLPIATTTPRAGDQLRIAGWGWTGTGTATPSRTLQTGTFTVTSVTDGTTGVVGLAPDTHTSACVYDSGAPYFAVTDQGEQLVSVESTGPTCPHDQEETTARVDVLTDWVKQVTRAADR